MRKLMMIVVALGFMLPAAGAMAAPPAGSAAPPAGAQATKAKKKASFEPVTGGSTLASVQKSGVLRVCAAVNAPWVMHDKAGKLIGYSVDVAEKFAADMGWKAQFVESSYAGLIDGLLTNQCDVVISGLSITPQRALRVRFTQPYGEYDIGIVVNRKDFPQGGIAEFEAAASGKKVAVRKGTVNAAIAHRVLSAAQIVEVDDEQQAIDDVRAGKFAAYVAEAPRPLLFARIYPDALRDLSGPALGRTAHGMALRRGGNGLLDVANAWIVDAQASGWLKARGSYWFDGSDWASQL